jgi:hypothetical protein
MTAWRPDDPTSSLSIGRAVGSYADSKKPDASTHMIRFCMVKSA